MSSIGYKISMDRGVMDFVAIDFETANQNRASACSVGLVKVRQGEVVDTFATLLRPPAPYQHFHPYNTFIHGISAKDVSKSPTLGEIWPEIESFVEDLPMVAHNAGFDMSVLQSQLAHEQVTFHERKFLCTLVLSRHLLGLPINKLPYVADHLGILLEAHHDALSDARAAAEILITLGREFETQDQLLEHANVTWGLLKAGSYRGSQYKRQSTRTPSVHHSEEEILDMRRARGLGALDEAAPLFGKVVSFSGTLETMVRDFARLCVEMEGGDWLESPNKKTDYFVVGQVDLSRVRPGAETNAKIVKAQSLHAKGAPIEILDEKSFLELLTIPVGDPV